MIGIVGAAGAVGRAATAALHRLGITDLRLGGRRRPALEDLALQLPGTTVSELDLFDAKALAAFCAECSVVLNCAGPAYEIGARVARAALGARANYVDAAGDDLLFQQVTEAWKTRPAAIAVVSAGMMPGLTALLPRYLAQGMAGPARSLTGYVGGRDRFTLTAAADFLKAEASFGSARSALRDGARVPAGALSNVDIPFFPEKAHAIAYLSTEIERVCASLGVANALWYSVFTGEHVPAALRGAASEDAPAALARAAALDSFGHRTYQLIVLELEGWEPSATRTLVLRGQGASDLTGEFAALTARSVAHRRVPSGVHYAGEILDPSEIAAQLNLIVLEGDARMTGAYVEETV